MPQDDHGKLDWELHPRQRLGLEIAAIAKVERKGAVWLVPSQSGRGRYTVCPDPSNPHCTCPDHMERGVKCKHLWAIEFVIRREEHPDGSMTVEETVRITSVPTKRQFSQNWPAYNAAQVNEKHDFQVLLSDLCQTIPDDLVADRSRGRPPVPLTAANYRSQGKLLSPSLPCYNVLHACVPNPVSTAAQTDTNKAAIAYCKQLYTDLRLNPIRGVVTLDDPPTLAMQSNPARVTDDQRAALDVFKTLSDQCRAKIATDIPRLYQIMEQINPDPHAKLMLLYQRQITIGEYNTHRQQMADKVRAAAAAPAQ